MAAPTPNAQLTSFVAKFTPDIAKTVRAVLRKMRLLVPGALELVYDNYNALAIGFSPTERASDVVVSVAVFPRWVSVFFFHKGGRLPDPGRLLRGSGTTTRHIVLAGPETLDEPAVKALIKATLGARGNPIDPKAKRRLVIKSIAAKQRPRRPA